MLLLYKLSTNLGLADRNQLRTCEYGFF